MKTRDLAIVGGSAGGLVVASVAAQLGLEVTLVEKAPHLGGDCLHHGCVPSKTLIHAAKVASLMRRGAEFGLPAVAPDVDLGCVSDRVQEVIDRIQHHDDPEARARGIEPTVLRFPFADVDRALTGREERGLVKLVTHRGRLRRTLRRFRAQAAIAVRTPASESPATCGYRARTARFIARQTGGPAAQGEIKRRRTTT